LKTGSFDNLICDRTRTRLLFTSTSLHLLHRRKYGYYMLPMLYGDRLIGRIDPLMDRRQERLRINAVHAEPKAHQGTEKSEKR